MNIIKSKSFYASAVIGLQKGYTEELITLTAFKESLLRAQQLIYERYQVGLSVNMVPCTILFLGQEEPSVTLSIIQYPKFQQSETVLKETFTELISHLMFELQQNRIVIQFPDETILLEQTESINPKITF